MDVDSPIKTAGNHRKQSVGSSTKTPYGRLQTPDMLMEIKKEVSTYNQGKRKASVSSTKTAAEKKVQIKVSK